MHGIILPQTEMIGPSRALIYLRYPAGRPPDKERKRIIWTKEIIKEEEPPCLSLIIKEKGQRRCTFTAGPALIAPPLRPAPSPLQPLGRGGPWMLPPECLPRISPQPHGLRVPCPALRKKTVAGLFLSSSACTTSQRCRLSDVVGTPISMRR